ncbi:amphiphysin [Trichonephila clavipes]|nr:amphiphysin [Trichonephila clavipes]
MADLNPFSKVLQKHAGRAKERILQNLGKADRTTDEDFDLHVKNFSKQHNAVMRLHKEFKNYYTCLRAMQAARRSLMDTVSELYEPCWDGVEQFLIKTEVSNNNFEDFCEKINCELVAPVGSYLIQFPEYTNKISKRNRKLLDYDNSRHNLQNLETMKKREDTKIAKAKEQLEDARNHFEVINSELHEELPALYDSRVSFFATHLQNLFLAEANFHKQDASLFIEMGGILDKLNEAYKRVLLLKSLDYVLNLQRMVQNQNFLILMKWEILKILEKGKQKKSRLKKINPKTMHHQALQMKVFLFQLHQLQLIEV